ncbi:hypothetical protein AMEX_G561 [Astyanax mexicanus]|uniref:Uncharacterized protein n=1 Tax=Astyanax mexicanus TaxID=7994 RepID=A0A8T2MKH4_ASTMX|nr:hypothetical protein AMEX_G561 [Astyanax mexicanus]
MQKVSTVAECDVILCFCPVVSRAGTDIEAALNKLDNESGNKPVVLVVLIHTLNPEDIVPDSSKSVNRENTLTVDCLFHEDQQLWKCNTNYDAIDKVTEYLKPKVFYSVLCQVYRHDNNDDDDLISDSAEGPLLPKNAEEEDSNNSFCRKWFCCCFGAVC